MLVTRQGNSSRIVLIELEELIHGESKPKKKKTKTYCCKS